MQTENFSGLDAIDRQIITILQENGKINHKELAALVGLTITPTYERVKRLEQRGVITGYKAHVDKQKIGKGLKVMCQLSLKSHAKELLENFEMAIVELDEVSACYHIAGNHDYLLHIEVRDMEAYSAFLKEKLATIPHISNVQSMFVMKSLK
ncbi:MAG: AsnC family transcriptional regulator [Crocinitomicaceae bacterium]|jgi:Lrp/AsnC family leucine-responsive transcriptional regulator|nr:AsnC family transcriptional regulator [Crocinitomicaceae bacterium]